MHIHGFTAEHYDPGVTTRPPRRRSGRLLSWGLLVRAYLFLIVYTPAGNWLFGAAPLGLESWLFVLPFAALMLALEEARKAWLRHRAAAKPL